MVQVAYFAAPTLLALSTLVRFALGTVVWVELELFWVFLLFLGWRTLRKFLPFASATLQVSTVAVRENLGVVAISVVSVLLVYDCVVVWLLTTVGVGSLFDHGDEVNNNSNTDDGLPLPFEKFLGFMVFCSLIWGLQVINNVVRFTTSGAVSTWWFMPSHEHDGKRAVMDAFRRATTYSFGSVCMASLLTTIAETLSSTLRCNDSQSLLSCVCVGLLSCLRSWLEMCNSFALVYAALYNSDYLTSGKQVVDLFKHVGWKTFINDTLIYRVLFMCRFAAATLTGLSSMALFAAFGGGGGESSSSSSASSSSSNTDGASHPPPPMLAMVYFVGFIMGLLASHPVVIVLESAVRTIMVCLAEQPCEFANAHPELYETLTKGWSEAYPKAWEQQKAILVSEPLVSPIV